MQKITNMYLMSEKELEEIINPDKCYTHFTKTNAKNATKQLLKYFDFKCWHDLKEEELNKLHNYEYDDYCSGYPVYQVFESDIADRMCIKEKLIEYHQ